MIELTRLNGEVIYLNYLQILYIEKIPESKVMMMNGDYYLVKDTVDEILEKAKDFLRSAVAFESKVM